MSTREKLISHYKHVQKKHEDLDKKITESYNQFIEDVVIHKMKQEKLHLKEELFNIERKLRSTDAERIPARY
jgi:hypothetical protein